MNNRDIVYIAAFAALTAALGLIPPIPFPFIPVPITTQSLGVMLAGSMLGSKRGGFALLLFLALVAIGLPILSGGRGGIGVFLGPSGGFLLAFPIAAFVIGWLFERSPRRANLGVALLFNILGGIAILYAVGIPWLAIATQVSLPKAAIGSAVFIPGDMMKAMIAAIATVTVQKTYPLLRT